jgi:hypothetical protein
MRFDTGAMGVEAGRNEAHACAPQSKERTMIARLVIIAALCVCATSANALSMKECSDKYKAAQAAGNKLKWNDFRKAECAADAAATPAAAPAAAPAAPAPKQTETAKPAEPKAKAAATPAAKPAEAPKPAAVPSGNAVFPNAVDPKYSSETAGKQRMHTCLDQYNANKANNGNAGLKWIEKGGGYYSECNKHLKG